MDKYALAQRLGFWWAEEFPKTVVPTDALIRLAETLAAEPAGASNALVEALLYFANKVGAMPSRLEPDGHDSMCESEYLAPLGDTPCDCQYRKDMVRAALAEGETRGSASASKAAEPTTGDDANCDCGHPDRTHPFGLSGNIYLNGSCTACGCKRFVATLRPVSAPAAAARSTSARGAAQEEKTPRAPETGGGEAPQR